MTEVIECGIKIEELGRWKADYWEMPCDCGLRYITKVTGCQRLSRYGVTAAHYAGLKIKG